MMAIYTNAEYWTGERTMGLTGAYAYHRRGGKGKR